MELTVDDHLAVIHGELQQVCTKYYDIGLQLKVPVRTLDTIKSQYKDSAGDCLRETIKEWLKSTTTSHTWQFLITALRAPTVGERQVAEKLSEKIPEPEATEQNVGIEEVDVSVQPDPADQPDQPQQPERAITRAVAKKQWFPEAHHVPIPQKRNILVLGIRRSGKTTVANYILGDAIFQNLKEPSAKKHDDALEEDGKIYDIQIVDTCGMIDNIEAIRTHVKDQLDSLNLVVFVTKNDTILSEEAKAFEFFTSKFMYERSRISQISALVITHCEAIHDEERKELERAFKNDSATKSIDKFMRRGIYRVGLPNLATVQPDMKPTCEAVARADTKELRKMMFESTATYAFNEVFPKLPWLYQYPNTMKGLQAFALMILFMILAPFYHQILAYFWGWYR